MERDVEIEVTTGFEIVEAERKRLINIPKEEDFIKWLGDRTYPLENMKKRFGETLVEKDGFIYANGQEFDDHRCYICNKKPKRNEKFIKMYFSFCDEYGCGMNICKKCLIELNNKLE
jgi:hypothetical protein